MIDDPIIGIQLYRITDAFVKPSLRNGSRLECAQRVFRLQMNYLDFVAVAHVDMKLALIFANRRVIARSVDRTAIARAEDVVEWRMILMVK
jgi:hypothetical protein